MTDQTVNLSNLSTAEFVAATRREWDEEASAHLRDLALCEQHPGLPTLEDVWAAEGIEVSTDDAKITLTFPDGHVEYRNLYVSTSVLGEMLASLSIAEFGAVMTFVRDLALARDLTPEDSIGGAIKLLDRDYEYEDTPRTDDELMAWLADDDCLSETRESRLVAKVDEHLYRLWSFKS